MSVDPLSLGLEQFNFDDAITGEAVLSAPFGVEVPPGYASIYCAQRGSCRIVFEVPLESHVLNDGEIAVLTHGLRHRICDDAASPVVSLSEFRETTAPEFPPADTETTSLIYGHFPAQSWSRNALMGSFPSVILVNSRTSPVLEKIHPVLDMITWERASAQPGWHNCVNRLVQLLFLQSVRAFVDFRRQLALSDNIPAATDWLQAAMDPGIGRVISLIHSEPHKPWTVALLAKQARMSKTSFSDRFGDLLGQPPLRYLTQCRMQKACQLIRNTDLGIKQVAAQVGYESVSSFTTAFKRWIGITPAAFRENRPAISS